MLKYKIRLEGSVFNVALAISCQFAGEYYGATKLFTPTESDYNDIASWHPVPFQEQHNCLWNITMSPFFNYPDIMLQPYPDEII